MKKPILYYCNIALAAMISWLGYSCDDDDDGGGLAMYGMPYGKFEVKGKVTDESKQPVSDARIIVKNIPNNGIIYMSDTTYTDHSGNYVESGEGMPLNKLRVVCEDTEGYYEPDSTDVELKYTGGDSSWDLGKAAAEVNFTLRKKGENRDK